MAGKGHIGCGQAGPAQAREPCSGAGLCQQQGHQARLLSRGPTVSCDVWAGGYPQTWMSGCPMARRLWDRLQQGERSARPRKLSRAATLAVGSPPRPLPCLVHARAGQSRACCPPRAAQHCTPGLVRKRLPSPPWVGNGPERCCWATAECGRVSEAAVRVPLGTGHRAPPSRGCIPTAAGLPA